MALKRLITQIAIVRLQARKFVHRVKHVKQLAVRMKTTIAQTKKQLRTVRTAVFLSVIAAALLLVFAPTVFAAIAPPGSAQNNPNTVFPLPNPLENIVGAELTTGVGAQGGAAATSVLIGRGIQVFLMFLAVAGLVVLVAGGLVWLTAGGSDDKIKKGRDIIVGAFLGLVIIFASYAIMELILRTLQSGLA